MHSENDRPMNTKLECLHLKSTKEALGTVDSLSADEMGTVCGDGTKIFFDDKNFDTYNAAYGALHKTNATYQTLQRTPSFQ